MNKNWNAFVYALAELYPEKFELSGNFASQGDKLRVKGTDSFVDILNDKFEIQKNGQIEQEIEIPQENGVDLEDRIEKIVEILYD